MAAGTSAAFSAQGQDAYHNNISGLTYNWSALSGGLNPATGSSTTYTTPESGSADTITVTSGDKTTTVAITLAYLDRIVVSPASATIPAGGGRSFTATGYDQFDNEMTGIVFDWTATGGTTEPGAGAATVYTAGTTPGAGYYVRASAFEKSADADITVTAGALDRIALSPDTATLTPAAGQVFTADGFDAWDNQISGLTFTWTATGGTVAPTIGGSTTFTAGAAPGASYYVRAASGTVFSDAAVTVTTGPLHRITVSPNSARLSIGASGIFTAQGYDAFNNPISNLTYTWTSTSGTVNPVTGSSTTFFAGTASGMTMVSAANGSITGSAWCSIASKIGVLYDYGNGRARLWSMDASGPGADEPLMAWFWNGGFDASRAKITSGDYNEDGKEEIGILYDYGNGRARLWSMDASGPGADEPLMAWFWNGGFDAARAKVE
jgi:hypothetical protein